MHREIAELFMYGDLDKNSILYRLGEIFRILPFDERESVFAGL